MYCLKIEEMYKIKSMFEGWEETLFLSCLQGYMGKAWTDDIYNPASAQIIVGDFCFFAGVPNTELVNNIPSCFSPESILMIPQTNAWEKLIEKEYPGSYKKISRYAIKKEPDIFDKEKLLANIKGLTAEYSIKKINKKIFHKLMLEAWSKDLCSQFPSYEDYEKRGIGFVAFHGKELVSGASSYTVYDGGIEIEIDTKTDYRRKGLALICASHLILECLDNGLYPSWDAANMASVALSEKLGYHFEREYSTYAVKNPQFSK